MKVLATAFEAFNGMPSNSSWQALSGVFSQSNLLKKSQKQLIIAQLPVTYQGSEASFDQLFLEHTPDACICFGMHSGGQKREQTTFYFEEYAYNLDDTRIPDNDGDKREKQRIDASLPFDQACPTNFSAQKVLQTMRMAGAQAELSQDPGRYVCNHLYYHALARALEHDKKVLVSFIHVPPSLELLEHLTQHEENAGYSSQRELKKESFQKALCGEELAQICSLLLSELVMGSVSSWIK